MAKICDRSPCDSLLGALGKFIFGAPERDGGFYMTVSVENSLSEVSIDYCPYCGTRLEEVPSVIAARFMKAKRKARELNS